VLFTRDRAGHHARPCLFWETTYVAFDAILGGQFLIFPNWIVLTYLLAGVWLFHRQVLREESFLEGHYGAEYAAYCQRVRRYL